jgi:hypothetical protein
MRIAQQIAYAFGVEVDKDVVRRVLAKHYQPDSGTDGPSWLRLIAQLKDSLWSIDLLRCESILLRSHCWIMVVMDVFTRRIIGFGVEPAYIDGSRYAECSIARLLASYCRNTSVPITTPCFTFTAGWPLCGYSRLRKSGRFRTPRFRIRSASS